jgi:ABC-2 type transport system permease protein
MFVIILLLTNITTIITAFGGDFDDTTNVYVVDETNELYDVFSESVLATTEITCKGCYVFESAESIDVNDIEENESVYITLSKDADNFYSVEVTSFDGIGNNLNISITTTINQLKLFKWAEVNEVDDLSTLFSQVVIDYENIDDEEQEPQGQKFFLQGLSMIISLPMFFLMMIAIQFLGLDIIDEKASKSIEIIVSNVSIGFHFASKLVSTLIFLVVQGILSMFYAFVGMMVLSFTAFSTFNFDAIKEGVIESASNPAVSGGFEIIFERLPILVLVVLAFLVVGYITYGVFCAIVASMATNTEDYQQMQAPLMIILLAAFYSAIFSYIFEGSLFIKILGFIPICSPMLAQVLYVGDQFTLVETGISFAILIVFNVVLIKYGLKLYRASILNYSDEKFLKRFLKVMKMSKQQ